MKLYYSPGACSLSPHIVALEAGLPIELELASTKTKKLSDGTDFHTINPLGYVPVLELDDGSRLREGPAIVQYLADQAPEKQLAPANGTMARYRLQEWLTFINSEIHKGYSPLFNPATPQEYKTTVIEKLIGRYQFIDGQLANRQWLMGDTFTVADAYLFVTTNWARLVKVDLSAFSHVLAWHARVGQRPAVQAAMKAEGLIK